MRNRAFRQYLAKLFPAPAQDPGRLNTLRCKTLLDGTRIMGAGAMIGALPAFYALVHGAVVPAICVLITVACAAAAFALQRAGRTGDGLIAQTAGLNLVGVLLAVSSPQIVDFGLAMVLLVPVHAVLLARGRLRKAAWVAIVPVVAIASFGGFLMPETITGHAQVTLWTSLAAFALTALLIGYTAHKLNAAFEVYEKSQINAFRHLVENVRDAAARYAPDGSVLFLSRSSENLFGCRRYELDGDGLTQRVHVLDRPTYLTALSDATRKGVGRTVELRMRKDEPAVNAAVPRFVWVEVSLSPVVENEPSPDGYEVVALMRDITDRKDREQELRDARKAAEEASEAKSRFLATVGHELRTPLNAIVGFSEMMSNGIGGELQPAHREYAELIHQSGHHLLEIVNMLLDVSRIEAGKFELRPEPFLPAGLIEPCTQIVERMAAQKKVKVVVENYSNLPAINADERACRQILINLLSNAIKFSNEGGVVCLGMRRQGESLAIRVTDYGIGMKPEVVARLGEPFFQADGGYTRRYEGTGLGLSIVRGLVELHQGKLHFDSMPGKGTTVTVLLPLSQPAGMPASEQTVTPFVRNADPKQQTQWQPRKSVAR